MRVTQEASPYAATLRSTIPDRIPTRVINAGQVQRELTQQSEEELQQTLADVHRAANLGDPELTGDAMIVVRFLVKNNLLGGVVRQIGNLGLNTTSNETASDQQQNWTIYQRNALDNLIKAKPPTSEPNQTPTRDLNLSHFNINLENGGIMKGLGKEISNIHQGPDALSHYLIKRLQTQIHKKEPKLFLPW